VANSPSTPRSPFWWVPTLYTAEGIPYVMITSVASIMYGNLGLGNDKNALYTSLLGIAWTIKPLWAPLLEMWGTRRRWVLATQFLLAVAFVAVGLALPLKNFLFITLGLFWIAAFLSSTHDIGADGVYISVTTQKQQANFVGAQGFFWNMGRILATGPLVAFTAYLLARTGSYVTSWAIVLGVTGAIMAVLALWHLRHLPEDRRSVDAPRNIKEAAATFADTLKTFFAKPGIWRMIVFVILYRSGEGFLEKIGPLFMMAPRAQGGLGLDNAALGHINGTVGSVAFMVAAILGGLYAARYGLRKTLLILCLTLNLPSAAYIYLSHFQPTSYYEIAFWLGLERVGWGFGSVGQMLYLMQQVAPGRYRTSHFAFGTALMALGVMIPGAISGYIQVAIGYTPFFIFVMVASIPSVLATLFAPFPVAEEKKGEPGAPATTPAH
jgi:MFS transporter, PAT family, beta-lactamase induction signal transducer AmpG